MLYIESRFVDNVVIIHILTTGSKKLPVTTSEISLQAIEPVIPVSLGVSSLIICSFLLTVFTSAQ
jgi:hypothetical protein